MSANLKGRIERLEGVLAPPGTVVLLHEDGERRDDCIRRHGYDPNARGTTFILVDKWDALA